MASGQSDRGHGIAIIGMAGRFPGASGVEPFWENLFRGVESITRFSHEQLRAAGVEAELAADPAYVPARGIMEGAELFDAAFFGTGAREAEVLDPQHRLLLEIAWEALERAGHDPHRFPGPIGVFAGAGINTYLLSNLQHNPEVVAAAGEYQAMLGSGGDFLATRISYHLGLRGPSLAVQTACSTSLVAVHLAVQSLLGGESDMALAGGVRLSVPRQAGHLFQPGGIFSPDGHCRPFDAAAAGIVEGEGAGLVVLRRLADALADGDHVHAVIVGSAVNNDGSFKLGYTAPSIDGQAEVVAMAQALAGIDPATIAFVEAHGTGTPLGDPIEVAALARAFAAGGGGERRIACALGSVKGNIGHLDTAAGVASLIKAALAVEHGLIPPSLHFERPNPQIDFGSGAFYVPQQLIPWPAAAAAPRRAGVSSFGIGGTNAHLVLEQAPEALAAPAATARPRQLVILSARTEAALEAATANLADHLRRRPEADLAAVASTLQLGRVAFDRRRIAVCDTTADAAGVLAALDPKRVLTRTRVAGERAVVFLFPGQGTQHPGMGAELYRCEPTFRAQVDLGAEILRPRLGLDLRSVLYPAGGERDTAAAERLAQTAMAQPALFVVEHALAQLWLEWGVRPQAMLGHSLGEYVAACLAGVWPFEDALRMVCERARLMQELPGGSMLAVPLPEAEVLPLLGGLSLAAVNGPALCVVSGAVGEVEDLSSRLAARGVEVRRLHTSHAFHSAVMDPILPRFAAALAGLPARPPRLPFLSNLTGTWIRPEEAVDPSYWACQLRETVRFAAGLEQLFARPSAALLEVGPGRALTSLARRHPRRPGAQAALASLPAPGDDMATDYGTVLRSLGQLWLGGYEVDWAGFHRGRSTRRATLPTYPFERQRYWVEPLPGAAKARRRRARTSEIADWFWVPVWRREPLAAAAPAGATAADSWLVLGDAAGFGGRLEARLREQGRDVAMAGAGDRFEATGADDFVLRPGEEADYGALLDRLAERRRAPARIVHAWCAGPAADAARELELGFFGLIRLARALAARRPPDSPPLHLGIVSTGVQRIAGEAELLPIRATLLGPAATIPQELAGVTCQAVDVDLPTAGSAWEGRLLDALIAELAAGGDAPIVAYRGLDRWLRDVAPWQQPPPAPALPPPGATWLITGGLGGVGLEIAALLARQVGTKLVLTSRQPFPDKAAWAALAQGEGRASRVARRLLDLETAGAEVWVAPADVTDAAALRRALDLARRHCGRIQGAVHAAGVAGGGLMARRSLEEMSAVLAPKVQGTLLLAELLAEDPPDLLVLCSSLNALFGGPGQADYAAANAFLDAFAQSQCGRMPVLSIDWDAWRGIGMAAAPFGLAAAPHPPQRPAASRTPETPHAQEAPPVGELQPFVHPLLQERGVRGDGAEVFVGRLRPGDSWIVDDHRLGGMPVMPGTAYLEMAGAAFREMAAATGAIEMRDVVFVSPMGLDDGQTREFQALLRRKGAGFHFTVQSREGADWAQHIVGTICAAPGVAPAAIDLASLAGGGWEEVTLGEAYREDLRMAGLGPRWEVLRKVYRRPGEAVGLLELAPEFAADVEELALHPAMLDVATGFAELFLHGAAAGGYYLPLSYKRIQVLGALPSRVYSHARLRTQELAAAETLAFDVTILDASGVPRMGIEEFVIKRVDVAAALRRRAGRGAAAAPPGAEDAERRQLAGGGDGMPPEQAAEALRRILAAVPLPQIAVSVRPLPELLAWGRALTAGRLAERAGQGAAGGHPRPDLDTPFVAPRNELEERMAAAWREVLGLDQVGVMDDFFELGGHSLLGTQLLSRVRETFGVEVSLAKLFTAATVADLAAEVEDRLTGSGPAAPDEIPRLPRDGELPLSFAQERIWFLDRLDRRNSFYNVSQAIRLEGPLEVATLSRAFSEIVRRHEVLHTAFVEVDGLPAQRVLPALPLPLPVAELSALPESRREAVAERLAITVTRRSFDLTQPPLLAVQLARLAPQSHVLVLTLHHIVADGWSIQVILAELGALYGAFLAGRQSPLAELPIQYADFAAWQRASFERLDLEEQLAYWRRQLAPPLPRLELPVNRPRPAIQTYRGRADFLVLPAELVTALKALCHREGATPFMALLAVLSLLLGRWSGQRDLLIGSPIAGRDRREVEGLIGIFLNTLVLRCDLSGAPTFRELLGRMRETALQAYARQGVPIEKLIEVLRPERDPSRAVLFQVLFNMQDFPRVDRKLPGLELTSLPLREVASKFDLTAYAAEVDGEILFELVSNADLFEPATVHALLDQLRHLVALVTTSPDESIDRFSLVTAPGSRAGAAAG